MSDSDFPLPPPTFEFLVFSLKTQAEMHLGLVAFGEESTEEPNFPAASHAIDMLTMLVDKTRGNLSYEEQRLIENSLTELRFRYVQATSRRTTLEKEKREAEKEKPEANSAAS